MSKKNLKKKQTTKPNKLSTISKKFVASNLSKKKSVKKQNVNKLKKTKNSDSKKNSKKTIITSIVKKTLSNKVSSITKKNIKKPAKKNLKPATSNIKTKTSASKLVVRPNNTKNTVTKKSNSKPLVKIPAKKIESKKDTKAILKKTTVKKFEPKKIKLAKMPVNSTSVTVEKNKETKKKIVELKENLKEITVKNKLIPEPKGKFELEYVIHSSPVILFEFLVSPSGLSEWFCDDVNIRNDLFTFFWDGTQQIAKLVKIIEEKLIRFEWIDKKDGSYFEFRIEKDELTNDISLIVTDFAENNEEKKSSTLLWNSQIDKLLHVLGSNF